MQINACDSFYWKPDPSINCAQSSLHYVFDGFLCEVIKRYPLAKIERWKNERANPHNVRHILHRFADDEVTRELDRLTPISFAFQKKYIYQLVIRGFISDYLLNFALHFARASKCVDFFYHMPSCYIRFVWKHSMFHSGEVFTCVGGKSWGKKCLFRIHFYL